MKEFEVSIEGKDVVLRSSAGKVESIRLNGGADFKVVHDNKIVLKIESPVIGANGLPTHEKEERADDNSEDVRQFVVASWIIANDGCDTSGHHIGCYGDSKRFKGIRCPLNNDPATICDPSLRVKLAGEWIEKYFQRKAEAAKEQGQTDGPEPRKIGTKKITAMKDERFLVGSEIVPSGAIIRMESPGDTFIIEVCNEKPETEADEKQGRMVKTEPVKSCGNCRCAEDIGSNTRQVVMCERTGCRVPVGFTGCPDFEPRISEKSVFGRLATVKRGAEAAEVNSKIAAAYLSSVDVCTLCVSAPPCKPSACAASPDVERIAQLEKENAELQNTNAHLREELVWQFEQLTKKIGTLQDQNDRLREELDVAKKAGKRVCRQLDKQSLQMMQRIKELEEQLRGRNQWPPRPCDRFYL